MRTVRNIIGPSGAILTDPTRPGPHKGWLESLQTGENRPDIGRKGYARMKYHVSCAGCGANYQTEAEFSPCFCSRCGSSEVNVDAIKSKARIHAENKMHELDGLLPKVTEARKEWIKLMAEYEDCMQLLRVYKKRGIVSQEEVSAYSIKNEGKRTLREEIKAYRKERNEKI